MHHFNDCFAVFLTEPIADIWLGELEFVDLFCGTNRVMPSIFTDTIDTVSNAFNGLLNLKKKRSTGDPAEIRAEDLTQEELNKYKLDHSLLYFRGHAFEWGAGRFKICYFTIRMGSLIKSGEGRRHSGLKWSGVFGAEPWV